MRQYVGSNDEARMMLLPATPALYVWAFDFKSLLGQEAEVISDAITRYLQQEGRLDSVQKSFVKLTFNPVRPPMRPDRLREVSELLASESPFAMEYVELLVNCQRPLYAGISRNLRRRTEEHLQAGDRLHDNLVLIKPMDCAIRWVDATELPDPVRDEVDPEAGYDDGLESAPLAMFESMLIRASTATLNKQMDS